MNCDEIKAVKNNLNDALLNIHLVERNDVHLLIVQRRWLEKSVGSGSHQCVHLVWKNFSFWTVKVSDGWFFGKQLFEIPKNTEYLSVDSFVKSLNPYSDGIGLHGIKLSPKATEFSISLINRIFSILLPPFSGSIGKFSTKIFVKIPRSLWPL
jgi:hypothetical protein